MQIFGPRTVSAFQDFVVSEGFVSKLICLLFVLLVLLGALRLLYASEGPRRGSLRYPAHNCIYYWAKWVSYCGHDKRQPHTWRHRSQDALCAPRPKRTPTGTKPPYRHGAAALLRHLFKLVINILWLLLWLLTLCRQCQWKISPGSSRVSSELEY